jgi:hypothetical protein
MTECEFTVVIEKDGIPGISRSVFTGTVSSRSERPSPPVHVCPELIRVEAARGTDGDFALLHVKAEEP